MITLSTSIFLIALGLAPSLIWLSFYLKKDVHPEPKYMISKTFLMGVILAPLAVILQFLFQQIVLIFNPGYNVAGSPLFFLWASAVEEVVKYLAVLFVVVRSVEFDEPTDAMIYMISAALGFAAIENILVLFQVVPDGVNNTVQIWIMRFIGATFLHALASAIVGYFLAMAWFFNQHKQKLILLGILIATLFHFAFNILLLSSKGQVLAFSYTTLMLITVGFLVGILFDKIKKRSEFRTAI